MTGSNGKLALGTAQFGMAYGVAGKGVSMPLKEVEAILDQAHSLCIDTLDTAVRYGQSETILGQLGVSRFNIISKLPALPTGVLNVAQWVGNQTANLLERLGVSAIRGLLLHNPKDLLSVNGAALYKALCQMREDGLVKKIGISVYGPEELEALFLNFDFDIVQAPLNILDQRLVESGWYDRLIQRHVEIHTRSVFLQGLLLMSARERPGQFRRFDEIWSCWDSWLSETGVTPLQACIRFALSVPRISNVIVGVDSREHLQEIVLAAAGELPVLPRWPTIPAKLINPAAWSTL